MEITITKNSPKDDNMVLINEKQSMDSEDEVEIYIKEEPTKGEKWLVIATKYHLTFYIIGNIYLESWNTSNELKENIEK